MNNPTRSLRVRTSARPPLRTVDDAARLDLLERCLELRDDLVRCAQVGLQWLSDNLGITRAVCLGVNEESSALVGLAGLGVPFGEVERFAWPLTDVHDPLVAAMVRREPTVLRAGRGNGHASRALPRTLVGTGAVVAVPLRGAHNAAMRGDAVGLLLFRGTVAASGDVEWFASVLGRKMDQVRDRAGLAKESQRLRRERALFLTIINAVPDPVLLTDTDGRLIVANARAEKLFAATDEESDGRRRAVELNNMLLSAALSRSTLEASLDARELLLVDPGDGSDLLFELLSTIVQDPREGTGVVSVLRNVTDLRRATEQIEENYQKLRVAEAAARAERDRLNLIIDSVADPILVTDQSGATVLMNAPAEELFATLPEAERHSQQVVQANDAHFSSFISGLLLGQTGPGETRRGEVNLTNPRTGEQVPVEAICGKVLTEAGELTAVVTILHDRREATERVRLYEQLKTVSDELQMRVEAATAELSTQNELLRRQALELEQASRLKSQFLANMSHEFRTPLNAILGYTQMLLQGVSGGVAPPVRRQLQRIDSNGRHLLTIINEILDITRIEAGRMPMQVSEFDLNALVPEVMAELDPVIARSSLTVTTLLGPHPMIVRSDRQKVKQIVVNLFSNALKFTPDGEVDIAISLDPVGRTASVAVADTGIGIAPEHHDKIFEDFRQVDDSPSRPYGGAGLGLAICRRLALALGGRISLRSAPGEGSTFTLMIPTDLSP